MRLLISLAVLAWALGVTIKTVRGVAWDRHQHQQDLMRAVLTAQEVQVLQDQGWHRDSVTGMWTP